MCVCEGVDAEGGTNDIIFSPYMVLLRPYMAQIDSEYHLCPPLYPPLVCAFGQRCSQVCCSLFDMLLYTDHVTSSPFPSPPPQVMYSRVARICKVRCSCTAAVVIINNTSVSK